MNPYLYQVNRIQFMNVWTTLRKDKETGKEYEAPMSEPTFYRRRSWAQEHYKDWKKVFLIDGRVDIKEYQKFNTFYSLYKDKERQDPHVKAMERGD